MARYDKASREVDQITRKIASVEKAARTRKAKERAGMPRGIKPDGFVDMNLRGYRGAGLAKTGTQELSTWAKVEHLTKGLRNQDEIARGLNSVLDTLFARVQRYIDQHSIPSRVKGWSIGVQGKFSTDSNPKTREWIEWPRPVQRQFYKSKRTAHDIGREDIRDLAKGQRKRHDFSGGIHYYQFRVTKLFVFALSTKGGF